VEISLFDGVKEVVELAPGAVWLKAWLALDEQRALVSQCRAVMDGPAGGYVPTVRGGGKMHVRMVCLGRHWNPLTYKYQSTRADYDNAAVPPLPEEWAALATRAAADAGLPAVASAKAGFAFTPDIGLINFYDADGRMGLHQDKDEGAASIAAGAPVVSFSIGDTARFLFGGVKRREPVQSLMLASGDVFVFGGPARLRYHGVARILAGTAPSALAMSGRYNLTFRQY
jgi:alkylated DNA repair protein (DNA oxidative demethylase)